MRSHVCLFLLIALVLTFSQTGYGAGFALYEGSARGNALGGAMVGRADDASAVFFNPAGITQLEGMQVMGGVTLIAPSTEVKTTTPLGDIVTETENNTYYPPHLYATYQMNDMVWIGAGLFSRFGLGTEFDSAWPGRYNNYNAEIQSLTFNPDIALKLRDDFSLAFGVSATWFDLKLQRKLPPPEGMPSDLDLTLEGDAIGYGFNVAARYEAAKWLALGASFMSEVSEDVDGTADIQIAKTDASGDVDLPAELFLGVTLKPCEKSSIEIGAVYTGWSSYEKLQMELDDPSVLGTKEIMVPKDWKDAWRYVAGVEYAVNEALDLRLGYVYDGSPVPKETVDYLLPPGDRQLICGGIGCHWNDWTLDLSYTYLMVKDEDAAARPLEGILPTKFEKGDAHMVGLSVSTKI